MLLFFLTHALILLLLRSLCHALQLYHDSCILPCQPTKAHHGVTELLKSSWAEVTQSAVC